MAGLPKQLSEHDLELSVDLLGTSSTSKIGSWPTGEMNQFWRLNPLSFVSGACRRSFVLNRGQASLTLVRMGVSVVTNATATLIDGSACRWALAILDGGKMMMFYRSIAETAGMPIYPSANFWPFLLFATPLNEVSGVTACCSAILQGLSGGNECGERRKHSILAVVLPEVPNQIPTCTVRPPVYVPPHASNVTRATL